MDWWKGRTKCKKAFSASAERNGAERRTVFCYPERQIGFVFFFPLLGLFTPCCWRLHTKAHACSGSGSVQRITLAKRVGLAAPMERRGLIGSGLRFELEHRARGRS
jgi:hypothetical protein